MCAKLRLRHAVVPLLHIRLLFGLLSSLRASDMHHPACFSSAAATRAISARHESRARRVPTAVVNLREERTSKVRIAPPHARHVFPGAMLIDEVSHDDEDVSEWSVSDH